jgi:hypothetical protein
MPYKYNRIGEIQHYVTMSYKIYLHVYQTSHLGFVNAKQCDEVRLHLILLIFYRNAFYSDSGFK